MEFCPDHIELVSNTKVILEKVTNIDKRVNGSIDDIKQHIEHGQAWRVGIVGVAALLIIQIIGFAYMYGQLNQKVVYVEQRVWAEDGQK